MLLPNRRFLMVQGAVFLLVSAAFSNIYLPQPVLPVLAAEFGVRETTASATISFVVLGIALANLPFGMIADRFRIRPIILFGGSMVAVLGFTCSFIHNLPLMVALRFGQGLFIPSLTTCLAAYLSRSLPPERLNVVMGSYVAATVAGGLGGRLLGGYIHPPLHWRYAFVSASLFLLASLVVAALTFPRKEASGAEEGPAAGFVQLVARPDLFPIFLTAFGSFFVFSSSFNYLPFYLAGAPFFASTQLTTSLYLSYLMGIFMGPAAGSLSNRLGNGATMAGGSVVLALGLVTTLIGSLVAVALGLVLICTGFFAVHSSAAGSLNRKLTTSRGRANSLYVLFYYLGGYAGITASGAAYRRGGWSMVVALSMLVLIVPFGVGLLERRRR